MLCKWPGLVEKMQLVKWVKWILSFPLPLNCCWSVAESVSQTTSCYFVELLTALRCLQITSVYHFFTSTTTTSVNMKPILSTEAAGSESCKRKRVGDTLRCPHSSSICSWCLFWQLFSFSKLLPSMAMVTIEPTPEKAMEGPICTDADLYWSILNFQYRLVSKISSCSCENW